MTLSRDEAARAFAERMGWKYLPAEPSRYLESGAWFPATKACFANQGSFFVPAPDAPLHEQMEFVGRVAEAIGSAFPFVATAAPAYMNPRVIEYSVGFGDPGIPTSVVYTRPDLSHAALLAALAALEER